MSKRLTSNDIARLAGVSQTTVSRVLQGLPSVKPETKERVLKVIREQEYLPSAAARLMKTRRSGTIAVVVANLSNPLYPLLLQLLVENLARQGFRTTVWELESAMDDATVRALVESPVDGVIFATATEETRVLLDKLATEKPLILVNRSVNSGDFDTVVSDNRAGGRLVARHFLAAGRRQIGLISTRSAASTIREREEGFIQALREAANPVECLRPSRGFDAFTYENGHRAMRELMAASPGVDSVFCTNDIVAIGALDAARSAGRRVPEDLWMVGYDDIPMARWDCIGLSTIQQPLAEMASRAVNRLQERIAEPDLAPETVVLPNDLVVRRTTT